MILTAQQSLLIIAVVALATVLTRVLPFLLFPENKKTPPYILYLGKVLPFSAIGLLIVYCLKDVPVSSAPHGLPEGLAIGGVVLLHLAKRNSLLSIGGGTALYMLLVQLIFV